MRIADIIVKKRDGRSLDRAEIQHIIEGYTSGSVPDYQVSAWLMAVVLRGMTAAETSWLADAMVQTGTRLDLGDVPGAKVDKHSTGGVGDKTSLILAPIAAVCGLRVPMMSGRGLGHTGGTLDKFESIPGFQARLSLDDVKVALRRVGCAMLAATDQIAPADRKLYALRDVTGTVESIPLISASVMSKKIAEGIDALVVDVKTGSGALIKDEDGARALAERLVAIGRSAGLRVEAVLSDMDTPLGCAVGNALEVVECIEVLKGRGPKDLAALSLDLSARMLLLGHAAADRDDADRQVRRALESGAALDRFGDMVEQQHGDRRIVDDYGRLPSAPCQDILAAPRGGFLARLDAHLVGRGSAALGAGRDRLQDPVDPGVGVVLLARRGERVDAGQPVMRIHYRSNARLEAARPLLAEALVIEDAPGPVRPLILGTVR